MVFRALLTTFSALLLYFFGCRRKNRGDRRWTFPNEFMGTPLLWLGLTQRICFKADTFASLSVEKG